MTEELATELCRATPEEIARASGSSFLVSFARMEPARRDALTAVYAFCRVVDDAVDESGSPVEGRARLEAWSEELDRAYGGGPSTPLGEALAGAARAFGVERRWLAMVVAGCAMDLEPRGYADLEDLEGYTYRVASAVGRACLPIFGAAGAERYADELGHALQMTNILRDVVTDARRGRIYVPRDALQRHGVDAGVLLGEGPAGAYEPEGPVHRVARELAGHARRHFAAAAGALPAGAAAALRAPRIMGAVYEDLLVRLEARRGEIRGPRVRVPRWKKLWIAWRT
jgi:phytoene synthase